MPDDGLRFEHEYSESDLDLRAHELKLIEPLRVAGSVSRAGRDIRVRGRLGTRITRACDRCLADVNLPIDLPFDLFYEPNESGTGEGEKEIHGRDLEFSVYENDEIDLDELVVEQLALNVPARLLCREDCRGLCDQCGIDLNLASCNCEKPIDPRWQALADLRERESNEN
jgi:DUF177 domain-containing protein